MWAEGLLLVITSSALDLNPKLCFLDSTWSSSIAHMPRRLTLEIWDVQHKTTPTWLETRCCGNWQYLELHRHRINYQLSIGPYVVALTFC